ncbi:hypothetical protein L810_7630 [Burkholderia sp. AU4i]|nr:hypothetical protein L810_7630 [Burkholderia sp. AU4i]
MQQCRDKCHRTSRYTARHGGIPARIISARDSAASHTRATL